MSFETVPLDDPGFIKAEVLRSGLYQKDSLVERLSKQAIEAVNAEVKEAGPDFWIEVYNKKFAALIVEECAKIGELKEQGYTTFARDVSVGWYMRNHFGM
jgi:hypothetical protein